jgi:hypothetical protein
LWCLVHRLEVLLWCDIGFHCTPGFIIIGSTVYGLLNNQVRCHFQQLTLLCKQDTELPIKIPLSSPKKVGGTSVGISLTSGHYSLAQTETLLVRAFLRGYSFMLPVGGFTFGRKS